MNRGLINVQSSSHINIAVHIVFRGGQHVADAGQEYEIYFNGLNEAQSGSLVEIRMYRVKFSPAQGLSFIGDEFGELTTEFEILSDTSKSGVGISKFMKVAQAV